MALRWKAVVMALLLTGSNAVWSMQSDTMARSPWLRDTHPTVTSPSPHLNGTIIVEN